MRINEDMDGKTSRETPSSNEAIVEELTKDLRESCVVQQGNKKQQHHQSDSEEEYYDACHPTNPDDSNKEQYLDARDNEKAIGSESPAEENEEERDEFYVDELALKDRDLGLTDEEKQVSALFVFYTSGF